MKTLRKSNGAPKSRTNRHSAGAKPAISAEEASRLVKQFIKSHPNERALTLTLTVDGKLRIVRARKPTPYKTPRPGYFDRFYTDDLVDAENQLAKASGFDPSDFR